MRATCPETSGTQRPDPLNAVMPHEITAGPLRAELDGDALRVGWDEPDWLGPGRLRRAGPTRRTCGRRGTGSRSRPTGCIAAVSPLGADEPVVVLRLEARDGATRRSRPATSRRPRSRGTSIRSGASTGGAPEGMRAFGHQYTEFALPVFSDAAMSRWRLLPIRPPVVLPLGLVAPDGRTILLAPLPSFHEQVIAVPAGKEHADAGLRAGWHGDIDDVDAGFATELAIIAGDGARDCFARWARLLRERVGRRRARSATPTCSARALSYWTDNGSAYWYRTEPGLDRRVDGRRRGRRPRSARRAGRRGAARLVVVSARGAAPVRHRRVGRAADGHGPLGAARRRAARRRRRAARAARPPAARRALPAPVVAVAVRRRVRDVGRRRPRAPAGRASSTSACSTRPWPGASRCSSTTG